MPCPDLSHPDVMSTLLGCWGIATPAKYQALGTGAVSCILRLSPTCVSFPAWCKAHSQSPACSGPDWQSHLDKVLQFCLILELCLILQVLPPPDGVMVSVQKQSPLSGSILCLGVGELVYLVYLVHLKYFIVLKVK